MGKESKESKAARNARRLTLSGPQAEQLAQFRDELQARSAVPVTNSMALGVILKSGAEVMRQQAN